MTRSTFPDPRPPEQRERGGMLRWRMALKMSMRQSLKSWPSSVLVVLLVLLPMAGVAAAAVYAESLSPSAQQRVDAELGEADAWVQAPGMPSGVRQYLDDPNAQFEYDAASSHDWIEPPADVADVIDADRLVRIELGSAAVETVAGIGAFQVVLGETWDPLLEGRYTLLEGRAPTAADEVLATPEALERLGAKVGDSVEMTKPEQTVTVTGTMSSRLEENPESVLFAGRGDAYELDGYGTTWYAEGWHATAGDVYDLNDQGIIVFDRALVQRPGDGGQPVLERGSGSSWAFYSAATATLVFCTYLVLLLAGAAFSVSAKRQQRSLAVAASVGASRADVFRIVLFQGTILGLAGGLLGSGAGIGLAALAREWFGDGSLSYTWGLKVPWWMLVGLIIIASVVGTLAALLPARNATRGDTLAALRGARRPVSVSAKRPKVGLGLIIAGAALVVVAVIGLVVTYNLPTRDLALTDKVYPVGTIAMILGPLLLQIGVVTAGHWLLAQVSRLLGRGRLGGRLAARDAVANPGRSVPSFGAIAACAFLATASIGGVATLTNMQAEGHSSIAPYGSVVAWMSGGVISDDDDLFIEDPAAVAPALAALADDATQILRDEGAGSTVVVSVPAGPSYTSDSDGEMRFDGGQMLTTPEIARPEHCAATDECSANFYERSGGGNQLFAIVAPDGLDVALGTEISAADRSAFAGGAVIVTNPQWLTEDGSVVVNSWRPEDVQGMSDAVFDPEADPASLPSAAHTETRDGILIDTETVFDESHQVYISPDTAAELGITATPSMVVADFPGITTAQLDSLRASAESETFSRSTDEMSVDLSFSQAEGPPAAAPWLWLILGAVTVLVIAASAVSLGLSRVERRPDDATLTAVGASPGVRRSVNGWQALVISAFGCIVGTVAGLMPVLGVVFILEGTGQEGLAFTEVPWLWYGLLALVLPVAVALVSWLVPPRAPDLTRRTAIA
ncbi:ABC transporter permease [Microbacterium nanhaiense]|nr:ABC transporter permease [Microbacterium nanhaiense]